MLYDHPQIYEAAFSFRDIAWEADFLCQVMDRYGVVRTEQVLEVACGHAPHAGELTAKGYQYIGLDKNPTMLAYAAEKWQHLRPAPLLIRADMVAFELPQQVQFAYVMLGSLYLNTLTEMERHFDAMARCLTPGGLYFLDWCIQFSNPLERRMQNTVDLEHEGMHIRSQFQTRLVNPAEQLYEEIWEVQVEGRQGRRVLRTVERNRAVFPQEFLLFIQDRTDFRFIGWWEDWDFERPIRDDSEPTRPVVLLRRR